MCRYICIGFIFFFIKGKSLLDYKDFCDPNEYKKNLTLIRLGFSIIVFSGWGVNFPP